MNEITDSSRGFDEYYETRKEVEQKFRSVGVTKKPEMCILQMMD